MLFSEIVIIPKKNSHTGTQYNNCLLQYHDIASMRCSCDPCCFVKVTREAVAQVEQSLTRKVGGTIPSPYSQNVVVSWGKILNPKLCTYKCWSGGTLHGSFLSPAWMNADLCCKVFEWRLVVLQRCSCLQIFLSWCLFSPFSTHVVQPSDEANLLTCSYIPSLIPYWLAVFPKLCKTWCVSFRQQGRSVTKLRQSLKLTLLQSC